VVNGKTGGGFDWRVFNIRYRGGVTWGCIQVLDSKILVSSRYKKGVKGMVLTQRLSQSLYGGGGEDIAKSGSCYRGP